MIDRLLRRLLRYKSSQAEQRIFMNPSAHGILQSASEALSLATQTKAPRLIARVAEIEDAVRGLKPSRVVEIGSGRSSIAFALLGKDMGFSHVAFEQSDRWVALMNEKINEYVPGSESRVEFAQLSEFGEGGYLQHDLHPCDLLYIDGPYVEKRGEPFKTFTEKPCYYDALRYFDAGIFPKMIMVEGRTDTVDLILSSLFAGKYRFEGESVWASQRKKWLQMAAMRRHSVFTLKADH